MDADAVDVTVRLPMSGLVSPASRQTARLKEALHRLAILTEWGIRQPPQTFVPEARDKYNVDELVAALLDEERITAVVADSGKGLHESRWFMEALLNPEGDRELTD